MKATQSLIVFACLVSLQCGILDPTEFRYRSADPLFINSVEETKLGLIVNLTCVWPNGCGEFARAHVERRGSSLLVTIIGRERSDLGCTTERIEFIAPVEINVPISGVFSVFFAKSDSTFLDTSIVYKRLF